MRFITLSLLALLYSLLLPGVGPLDSGAKAENGCPAGMTPNPSPSGTPGSSQCVPFTNFGGSSAPQAPQGHWVTRWGAYAFDPEAGKVGTAGSMSSENKAKKAALAHCKSKGGANCQIQMTYHNQCAVAISGQRQDAPLFVSFQSAATREEASSIAEDSCSKAGASECKIAFSDCSYAEFVQ